MRLAAIARDQPLELVEIEDREAACGDRSQIAAAAFHGEHAHRIAGQRIGPGELRARVAAAEVRDAQVRPEQIRSISQQFERLRREPARFVLVPQIFEQSRLGGHRFRHT